MNTELFNHIQKMEQQILDYKRAINSTRYCLTECNYCVVDAECYIFTIGVDEKTQTTITEHKMFPTLFRPETAMDIVEHDTVQRKNMNDDGWHKVELKVMSDVEYYQMRIEQLTETINQIKTLLNNEK